MRPCDPVAAGPELVAAVLQFLASKTSAPEPGEAVDGEVINDARSIESEPNAAEQGLI